MTNEEKLALVRQHYALNGVGDFDRASALLTDDFFITVPSYMPFGGTYRGKDAFRTLVPIVKDAVAVAALKFVATTTGPDCAIEIVEFTLEGDDRTTEVAELIRFRGRQICEIRPYYSDPGRFAAAAARQRAKASVANGTSA